MYHQILVPTNTDFINCNIDSIDCKVGQHLQKDDVMFVLLVEKFSIDYVAPFDCIIKSINVISHQDVTSGDLIATIEPIGLNINPPSTYDISDNRVIWNYKYDFTGWSMDVYKVVQLFVKVGDIVQPNQLIASIEIEADAFNMNNSNKLENVYSEYTGEVVYLGKIGEMSDIFSLLIDPSEYQSPWR